MKIVLLGGNSSKNIFWLESIEVELKKKYNDVFIHYYSHWSTNAPLIDLDKELESLRKELENIKQYVIIAKSAGVLLALKGISEQKLFPAVCVFIGIPVMWARENNFNINQWLKSFSIPTLFIQEANDPAISSNELEDLLKELEVQNYKIQTIPGDKHEYSQYQELGKIMISFLENL